ncbi:hypothetical protein AALA69_02675 [Eggerthellaceae bacterium 24-137]
MKKSLKKLMCASMATMLALGLTVSPAMADEAHAVTVSKGAQVTSMQLNRNYQCDITGDKKADTVRITFDDYAVRVKVNGKTAYTKKNLGPDFMEAKIITLKNGKSFLYYTTGGASNDYNQLLKYSSGKMKSVIGSNKLFPSKVATHPSFTISKVSGNTVFVDAWGMLYSTSATQATFKYVYKNGTLKRASNTTAVKSVSGKKTLKAARSMKAYTSAKCTKGKFTIKKGQKVAFKKIYTNGKTVSFQVKAGGKTGWIKAISRSQYNKYGSCPFKGIGLAG